MANLFAPSVSSVQDRIPTLPDRVLLERWHRDRDEAARDALTERYLGFSRSVARRFARMNEPIDDLEQVAAIGLLHAIDRYDIERDVALTTFAMPTIVGELRRHFRDRVYAIRVPRGTRDLSIRVTAATERLGNQLGRSPTPDELATELGQTKEAVLEALVSFASRYPSSLTHGDDDELGLVETLGVNDGGFEQAEDRAYIEPALKHLNDREAELLRLRFVEGMSQAEIAARLSISQMHVSRLLRRALSQLQGSLQTA